MAVEYRFTVKGEGVTLNQMDELLCKYSDIEVDDKKYCNLYQDLKWLGVISCMDGVERLNSNTDFEPIIADKSCNYSQAIEAIKDLGIEMYMWR